jgi:NAD+ kinase
MATHKMKFDGTGSVAIVYRPESSEALKQSHKLTAWLLKKGYQVYTAPNQKTLKGTKALTRKQMLDKLCLVVALGGDGTYLRAVRTLEGRPIPILGVNLGSLGFLTETRAEDLLLAVEKTLNNEMELYPRTMLEVKVKRKGKVIHKGLSLNDVVIERGSLSQLINLAIYSEKFLVSELKADGLIVSTPTGSTAYNLAAGGPILHPQVMAIAVTPIAPHALTSRPMIFPDDKHFAFKLIGRHQKGHFVVDGQKQLDLHPGDEVSIAKSAKDHFVVRAPSSNYFNLLREKLKFGDRA